MSDEAELVEPAQVVEEGWTVPAVGGVETNPLTDRRTQIEMGLTVMRTLLASSDTEDAVEKT